MKANPSDFRGDDLRDGWRKLTIPEETVDLFELYIALAMESIGVNVKFVDSWYYHVNHGEIHCGQTRFELRAASHSVDLVRCGHLA